MDKYQFTENMKIWLAELFIEQAREHRGAAANCHIFALGSDGEEAQQFEEYREEHIQFAQILETMCKDLGIND